MYVSYDDGKNWESLQLNLPVTPVTDIKIYRGNLILSTMGRSFWILDNINLLRYNLSEDINLYPVIFSDFLNLGVPRFFVCGNIDYHQVVFVHRL